MRSTKFTIKYGSKYLTDLYHPLLYTVLFIIYKLLLDINFVYILQEYYSYSLGNLSYTTGQIVFSYCAVLVFLPAIINMSRGQTFSDSAVFFLFVFAYIPGITLYSWTETPQNLYVLFIAYFIVLYVSNRFMPTFFFSARSSSENEICIYIIAAILIINILIIWVVYARLRINISFDNIYLYREEAGQYNIPTIMRYMFTMSKMVLPTILIYFLNEGKKFLVVVTIISETIAFFIDGSKSTLFVLAVALVGYYILDKSFNLKIVVGSCIMFALSIIEYAVAGTYAIAGFFIRRLYFVPANLNKYYYAFFNGSEKDLFRQSILGKLGIRSPYTEKINVLVGHLHSGGWDEGANNGLFSDAYANLGVAGMVIMPIIIVFTLKIVESIAHNLDKRYMLAASVTIPLTLLSSSYFTVLLSHGVLLVCIVFMCIPRDNNEIESRGRKV